jgi:ribosomal protein S18 acetylase RimI-like enzyme
MPIEVAIRRARPHEYDAVRELIKVVVTETFKDLFAPNAVPLEFKGGDWPRAWVAASSDKILGVIITGQEWVDDLWVLREHRQQGVGSSLLTHGESEIAARGFRTCRLRVAKSNLIAVKFYSRQGWRIAREFAHEKYGHPVLEMAKSCPSP